MSEQFVTIAARSEVPIVNIVAERVNRNINITVSKAGSSTLPIGSAGQFLTADLSGNPTWQYLTTANISDSINKRYLTDNQLANLANQSGTNTGDETGATIKAKLGFTPYDSANPSSFISGITKQMVELVLTGPISTHTHTYEPVISVGTALQYLTGLKTWATLPTALPASDVYAWAKASVKPSYTYNEVGAAPSSNVSFPGFGTTSLLACVGNDSRLSDSRTASDVYAWAKTSVKPSYVWTEIGSRPVNLSSLTNDLGNYGAWASLASPTFTGTVSGVTAAMVGLGNVTNNAQWYSGNHPTTVAGYGITDIPAYTLSGLGGVPITTTVNGHALSGNITITAADLSLNNLTNDSQVKRSEMGTALGVATLDGSTKIPLSQIPVSLLGQVNYQGGWNASTNTPALPSTPTTTGNYYIVTTAGSTSLGGITDWKVGDWIIANNAVWGKVDNTDAVAIVNGYTGTVILTTADISEVTNLYYTDARVSANTNVAANTAARHSALTIGTSNGLSLAAQALSLQLASTTLTGALSSTDWNTFNGKQAGSSSLTSLAALTYVSASFVKLTAAGTFSLDTNAYSLSSHTHAGTYEPVVAAGTTSQYYRGDKSWQTLNSAAVSELTNLYYTDTRARASISLTTTGTSGAATYSNSTGVLNIPTPPAGIALTALSATTPLSYNNTTGVFTIQAANTTLGGYITSADWNTFNGKQNAITAAALTKTDDTNVTLTLGGSPAASLLAATSLAIGWTGTLADGRIASASTWNAKQAGSTNLTSISALTYASASFVKMTASGTFALDTSAYVTGTPWTGMNYLVSGGALGTPSGGTLTNCTFPTLNQNTTGSAASFTGSLAGDVTGAQGATTISAATVTGKLISGYTSGAGTVSASDSILSAIQKLNGNNALMALLTGATFTGNITVPNVLEGYSTTATAGGSTTLTVASNYNQFFTGTLAQTVVLPVVSTLVLGFPFCITNNSTGLVTVNSSGGNAVIVLAANTTAIVTCILITGTTAASWSVTYMANPVASGKKLTASNSLTLAGTDGTTQTFQTSDTIVGRGTTDTLTNKRNQPRVFTATSTATLTPEIATYDLFTLTAQAAALTIANHSSSTPTAGEKMIIRIKDNGTARALSFGTYYRALGNVLPTTTVISKTMYLGFIWNSTDTKWDLIAYTIEA